MLPLLELTAGFLAAAVLILALPVELQLQIRGMEPLQGRFAVRTLFGQWQKHLPAPTPRQDGGGASTPSVAEAAKWPSRGQAGGLIHLRALWSDLDLRQRALGRLRTALDTVRWRALHLHLRLGLDDPADTGRLWAVLGPLGAGLASLRTADVAIEPDFGGPTLDFDARAHVAFVPLRLLWSLAVLSAIFGLALARQHRWRQPLVT